MAMEGFSGKDAGDYEFSIEPVIGVRGFRVDKLGRLTGWAYQKPWSNGENIAVCHRMGYSEDCKAKHNHDDMGMPRTRREDACIVDDPCDDMAECDHGFWAYFDDIQSSSINMETVHGVVAGYGKVLVGEKGFRAEKAKIEALCLPKHEEFYDKATKVKLTRPRTHVYSLIPLFTVPALLLGMVGDLLLGFGTAAVLATIFTAFAIFAGSAVVYVKKRPMVKWTTRVERKSRGLKDHPQLEKIKAAYPDVKIYYDRKSMLDDFPMWSNVPKPGTPEFFAFDENNEMKMRKKKK